METIKNYLDALFLKLPDTYEVRNAKKDLLALSEDKYEQLMNEGMAEHEAVGRVISDFGSLDEIATDLGLEKMADGSFCTPGAKENYSAAEEKRKAKDEDEVHYGNKYVGAIMDVFWPTVTCIYLIWSFLSFNWGFTWIIWPVAAVVKKIIENIWGEE